MDFDTLISFLLILLFFAAPVILKRMGQKKESFGNVPGEKAPKLSLFERLGDQIREYAQTLEQQAAKGQQVAEEQQKTDSFWDQLADDTDVRDVPDPFEIKDFAAAPVAEPQVLPSARVIQEKKRKDPRPEKPLPARGDSPACGALPGFGRGRHRLSVSKLQQAIVWSEILSKPIALREK